MTSAVLREHPCFSHRAHHRHARLHLPVAPACNLSCAYCDRGVADCPHTSRPGLTSRVLSPDEAPPLVEAALRAEPRLRVVGIAGPGEPLANEATFEALALVRRAVPAAALLFCVSTNGLLLPDKVPALVDLGVSAVTVTVNTLRPETGRLIYSSPAPPAQSTSSSPASASFAARLISRQFEGLRLAAKAGLTVKLNTVLIPGVNSDLAAIAEIAEAGARAGAGLHNIVPLIPLGEFADRRPPTCEELRAAREAASRYLPQFRLCRQCRADAFGVPGEEHRASSR